MRSEYISSALDRMPRQVWIVCPAKPNSCIGVKHVVTHIHDTLRLARNPVVHLTQGGDALMQNRDLHIGDALGHCLIGPDPGGSYFLSRLLEPNNNNLSHKKFLL